MRKPTVLTVNKVYLCMFFFTCSMSDFLFNSERNKNQFQINVIDKGLL